MKNNKKLGFAIIGAGAVASHHVKALRQLGDVEILSICGNIRDKTLEFAAGFDIPWTTDYREILANPDVDVIDIAVPSGLHAETGIAAAKAGKNVIVEKPIDVTLEKADRLINECKKTGVTLGVMSQYRFLDASQKLYDILKQNKLGALIHGEASIKWYRSMEYYNSGDWRGTWELDGGGPFINQGIHFIDLLLSVMGPVKWVYGKTRNVSHDIQVEDIGMAMLEFTNGTTGVIQASTATFPGLPARLDIHGTEGTVVIEGEKLAFVHIKGEEPFRDYKVAEGGAAKPMDIDLKPFVREFEDIVSAIREKREPIINGNEARRALQLVLAIYESSKKNQPVYLN
ncbi:Gfo/Idh/MocA family oxidoreductase [candidate division KSB1 bacterium]|nr:Gfo/Idh/MocA family oxidoreductase [candidate division KSB1 bacterium]